jgi:hypothetical protein
MSTAAPTTSPTNSKAGAAGYEVARPQGRCCACGAAIAPETKFMAALRETPAGFERLDCCLACWERSDAPGAAIEAEAAEAQTGPMAPLNRRDLVGFWKTTMPHAEARKKVFVDDDVLLGLFERLADTAEPAKLNFRFVLGLILMRKRMLLYESSRQEDGRDIWSVRCKGRDDCLDLLNPQLNEEQIQDVSQQLGQILNEEL